VPGAACLVLVGAATAGAVELRRLDVSPGDAGASVRLILSAPARATVKETAEAGMGSRVCVDLPRGTRLGRGAARGAAAVPPLTRVRTGLAEGGVVRVVLDLEPDGSYRVRQRRRGAVVTIEISAAAEPPRAEATPREVPAAVPPRQAHAAVPAKIVLDPGHGGDDPGAQGYAVEKEVTLAIARRVAALLDERLGAEVVLTRTADTTLPLSARTAQANAADADLFVSIHANASPSRRRRGIETYYLNNTSDRATIRLAAMENGLDLIRPAGGTDLRYILSDLVQVGKMEESIALARAVQGRLVGRLRRRHADVVDLGVKQGPFYVLVGAYMPCVLVETSFLTHPTEGPRLASAGYREAVAEGIYDGIARFLADSRRARTL
jgi:N-acetylmuramoyl-L-alanine amidase